MNNASKINSFKDLNAWREGHKLVLFIYKITKVFPRDEVLSLVSQMRRAAISITSNIAEGFSRKSYKEKVQFYYMALGSLTELENQIIIAHDIKYISLEIFNEANEYLLTTHKLLSGLIKASRLRF